MVLIENEVLVIPLTAWFLSEIAEWILNKFTGRDGRLFDSGGMPSSHSAVVCATASVIGLKEGFDSSLFGLSAVVAVVVLHDAVRVRWMAGVTAEVVNKLGGEGDRIAVYRGHRLSEVVAGSVLGIVLAVVLYPLI